LILHVYAENFVQYLTNMFWLLFVLGGKKYKGYQCSQDQGHIPCYEHFQAICVKNRKSYKLSFKT
jgi:hypothetical protein